MKRILVSALVSVGVSFTSVQANAWGRRGHAIICQTAAALIASHPLGPDAEKNGSFLKKHSFDLGYGCNVPDLIWKKPSTYAVEAPQHFMDLEVFNREFAKAPSVTNDHVDPFSLSRSEFEKTYPAIPAKAGRAYWRIRELTDLLHQTADSLKKPLKDDEPPSSRFGDQEKWLTLAGAVGHYVGDLSQPLHVTEDYDAHAESQDGLHAFFEDVLVDELSSTDLPGRLEADVGLAAQRSWTREVKNLEKLSTLDLIERLAKSSNEDRKKLLEIDKRLGRKDLKKAAKAHEPMIKDRLAAGALTLAILWRREVDWIYRGDKFYNFDAAPAYITPGSPASNEVGPKTTPAPSGPGT